MRNDAKEIGEEKYTPGRKSGGCSDVTVRNSCDLCATAALAGNQANEHVQTRFHSFVQFAILVPKHLSNLQISSGCAHVTSFTSMIL